MRTRMHIESYAMDTAASCSKIKLALTERVSIKFEGNSKILLQMNSFLLVLDFDGVWSSMRRPFSHLCFTLNPEASGLSKSGAIEENGAWVKVVDPEYEPGSTSRGKGRLYRGYMRCHLNRLQSLVLAGSMKNMSRMIHRDADGIPWFGKKSFKSPKCLVPLRG